MKNRNIYLYIAGALACMMFGSLWNEFVAPHLKLETKATGLKPESCPLRSNGAERSERNPANSLSSVTSHLSTSRLSEGRPKLASGLPSDSDVCGEQPRIVNCPLSIINLNESSFKDLVHHPFLSYEQVKAVKNFQRKYGRIRNMTELLILPEFTVEDTLRLSPYLQF